MSSTLNGVVIYHDNIRCFKQDFFAYVKYYSFLHTQDTEEGRWSGVCR